MRPYIHLCVILVLLLGPASVRALDQKPLWRINLRAFGYPEPEQAVVIFCGPFLIIYPDYDRPALVFDIKTHTFVSEEHWPQIPVTLRAAFALSQSTPSDSSRHIVARWKEMVIHEVCDQLSCTQPPGKPSVRDVKFYLESPGKPNILLWQAHCLPGNPLFLAENRILIIDCNLKTIVVDPQGRQIYKLPVLAFPYLTVNRRGTRFAAYERYPTFFHEITGTSNRLRVKVFESANGRKLLEVRWHLNNDSINDGRVALSDDGALVAIIREGEVLLFALPAVP